MNNGEILQGDLLQKAIREYGEGLYGKKQLRETSKKNRKKFILRLKIYLEKYNNIYNEETARSFIESMKTRQDGKPAKPATVATNVTKIRSFTQFCIDRKYLSDNFAKWINKPPEDETFPEQIHIDLDIEKVMKAISLGTRPHKGDRSRSKHIKQESRIAQLFMLHTGRRSGEVVKLQGSDIHMESEKPFYIATLKGGKRKSFPIPKPLLEEFAKRSTKAKVFDVTPATTILHFRNGLRKIGFSENIVEKVNNHTFRKLFVQERYRNDSDIAKIAHAIDDTPAVVWKYYLAHEPDPLEETVNNSRVIRHGLPMINILKDIEKQARTRIAKDDRFETLRVRIEEDKFVIELPFSKIGISELKKNQ